MSLAEAQVRIADAAARRTDSLDLRALGLKTLPPLPATLLRGLQALELGSNRLSELPVDLLDLPQLRRLGLGNNRLKMLPPQIAQLPALLSLDLSENQLNSLPAAGLPSALIELSLFANRLIEIPGSLLALRYLERLDLSTNSLVGLPPLTAAFSRLQVLDVSRNKLRVLPAGFGALTALRLLNLSHNQLTSLDGLGSLPLLEELDVSDNRLTRLPPAVAQSASLRRIRSSGNPFADPQNARAEVEQESLAAQARDALKPLISGGGSPDVRYFDAVPFKFDFSLSADPKSLDPLIDLYYKGGFGKEDMSLKLPDGSELALGNVTRTTALETVRARTQDSGPVRVSLGSARTADEMQTRSAFAADALTQIPGVSLIGGDGKARSFADTETPAHSVLLQWSQTEYQPKPAQRRVGVGFAPVDKPDTYVAETEPLPPGTWLWLWCRVEAAEHIVGAIGGGQPLSPAVLDHADLEVAVFANPQGFELEHRTGVLRVAGAEASVLRAAGIPDKAAPALTARSLFFKVKSPSKLGLEQLRVHLYYRGLLVQALDVVAWIGPPGSNPDKAALTIEADYVLSSALDPPQLRSLGEHALSIFVNDSPGDTHGFRFFTPEGEIALSANIQSIKIQSLLDKTRAAFRWVSWRSTVAYDPSKDTYQYEETGPTPDFKSDLVCLAKCGYQLWDALAKDLAADGDVEALHARMQGSRVVHLGLKESSSTLLPLAILYDYPLETEIEDLSKYKICEAYTQGDTCFSGNCPNRSDPRVVCPSGFWGFRHALGIPVGTTRAPDASGVIAAGEKCLLASAYAGTFPLRDQHLADLEKLIGSKRFDKKLTREETVGRMKAGGFQVLYFYCHGGVANNAPYVIVGNDTEDPNKIARDTLRTYAIQWKTPHALVFINGCHTTELKADEAIDLVNGFVETAQASGVIGTEVTVFESLATRMAQAFFQELLSGAGVGTALRNARLSLLLGDRPNPLGLVYIPFALATLKLEDPVSSTAPTRQ